MNPGDPVMVRERHPRRATVVELGTSRAPSGDPIDVVLVEFPRGHRRWVFQHQVEPIGQVAA